MGAILPLGQAGDGGKWDVALANNDVIAVFDPFEKFAEAVFELADGDGGSHGFFIAKNLAKSICEWGMGRAGIWSSTCS